MSRRDRLIKTLNQQKQKKNLILVDMYIENEGCQLVSTFLKSYPHYAEVDLKSNKITSNGLLKLCEAFQNMNNLKVLSLNNNYLGTDNRGMEGLYSLLVSMNSSLEELNLRNNQINDGSVKVIADFIKDSGCLRKLDLRYNKISTLGGEILLMALDRKEYPVQVQITGN